MILLRTDRICLLNLEHFSDGLGEGGVILGMEKLKKGHLEVKPIL